MQFGNSANDQLGVLFNFVAEGNKHKANMLNQALQEYQIGAQYNDDDLRNNALNKINSLNRTPLDQFLHMVKGEDRPSSHIKSQQDLQKSAGEIFNDNQTATLNQLDAETGDKDFSQYATMLAKDKQFAQKYGENENQSQLQGYKQYQKDKNIGLQYGTLGSKQKKQYERDIKNTTNRLEKNIQGLSDEQIQRMDSFISQRQQALDKDSEARKNIATRDQAKTFSRRGERIRKDYDFSENHKLVEELQSKGVYRDRLEGSESDMRQQNYDMAIAMYEHYSKDPKMQKLIEDRWRRGEESIDGYWGINNGQRNRSLFDKQKGTGFRKVDLEPMRLKFTGADGIEYEERLVLDKSRINDLKYINAEIDNQVRDKDLAEQMKKNARVVAKASSEKDDAKENTTKEMIQQDDVVTEEGVGNYIAGTKIGRMFGLEPETTVEGAIKYGDKLLKKDPKTNVIYEVSAEIGRASCRERV